MLSSISRIHTLRFASLIAPAAVICTAPGFAQEPNEYLGERPERYAMVRHIEGAVNIFKGDADEELTIGTPIAEGDVIEGRGRGVIQLGDGTRIAFGEGARLLIATLFEDQDGRTQALFRLDSGRLRVAVGSLSGAYIRIDTPSGSFMLESRGDASLEVGADRSVRVKVFSGSVAFRNSVDEISSINAGERLTIYDNGRSDGARAFNINDLDTFEKWAEPHMAYKRSENSKFVPSEIRYYADTLDGHGDWVQVADVGWCWRPRVTIVNWRPYWRGHWGAYRGGMTWVSYDPFGYLTHHYGRWGWSSYHGWYWIPGVYYSPAWVAWNIESSFFGWAPLGYYNRPIYWGYRGWRHDLWNVVDIRYIRNRHIYNHTRWDASLRGHFPGSQGNRPLTAPWKRGPMLVTRNEFNNPDPNQFRKALSREVSNERLIAYEQLAGNKLLRRDTPVNIQGTSRQFADNRPFEDQSSRRALAERPVLRERQSAEFVSPTMRSTAIRRTLAGSQTSPERAAGADSARNVERGNTGTGSERRANTATADGRTESRSASGSPDTSNRRLDMRDERRGGTAATRQQAQDSQANTNPPNRTADSRGSRQADTQPSRSTQSREAPRETQRAPSRTEARPSTPPPSTPPARTTSPPPSSPPPARTSPPPDRSRNVRR